MTERDLEPGTGRSETRLSVPEDPKSDDGRGSARPTRRGPREWLTLMDDASERALHTAVVWMWPLLYGVLLGSSTWWLTHRHAFEALGTNRLADELRRSALHFTGAGVGAVLLAYAVVLLFGQRPREAFNRARVAELNRWFSPTLTLPFLLALLRPGFETRHPQMAVAFSLLIGAAGAFVVYRLPGLRWPDALPRWLQRVSIALSLGLLWLGYGLFFSNLSITNHHGLNTSTFDLGIYDNIFYQSLQGTFLGCSFMATNYHGAAHFDPILTLLSPLYLFYPRAESILVLQSFWLGAGVFPLYQLARRRLACPAMALCVAACWLLYPALHGANMYDFHSLSLLGPIVLYLLYFADTESHLGYWLCVALSLLVREDVPLLLCFIAGASLLGGEAFARRQAWLTILSSVIYFVVVKAFFMGAPEKVLHGTQQYSFAYYYAQLIPNGTGITELVTSLLTNPSFALTMSLVEKKVQFLLLLFAPLGFLPFFAKPLRWSLLYGFVFCLLATREAVFSIYFQYAIILYAVAFPAAVIGLHQLAARAGQAGLDPARVSRTVVALLLLTSALVSFKFGGLVDNEAFRGGFVAPKRELSEGDRARYAWVEQAAERIPRSASVATTRRLGPHVSNRSGAFQYLFRGEHDFLFVDESEIESKRWRSYQDHVREGGYVILTRLDKLVLYQRNPS